MTALEVIGTETESVIGTRQKILEGVSTQMTSIAAGAMMLKRRHAVGQKKGTTIAIAGVEVNLAGTTPAGIEVATAKVMKEVENEEKTGKAQSGGLPLQKELFLCRSARERLRDGIYTLLGMSSTLQCRQNKQVSFFTL
jgi:hypothetical protein